MFFFLLFFEWECLVISKRKTWCQLVDWKIIYFVWLYSLLYRALHVLIHVKFSELCWIMSMTFFFLNVWSYVQFCCCCNKVVRRRWCLQGIKHYPTFFVIHELLFEVSSFCLISFINLLSLPILINKEFLKFHFRYKKNYFPQSFFS